MAQKGTDLLVEVATRLRRTLGSAMPVIEVIGDGPDRTRMESSVEAAGLESVVRFRGRLDGVAKFEQMAGAHAVLMPSRFETFGLVAVEAQAAGVPVIAFDVGPLRDVAGEGGASLIAPFDVDAFAREVVRIVADPELRRTKAESGRRWASRYDWDVIAELQEARYVAVLEHARRLGGLR
jgi:glycosyltransferase involved in cell wall biosynthesis